jgi:hypothetical protein
MGWSDLVFVVLVPIVPKRQTSKSPHHLSHAQMSAASWTSAVLPVPVVVHVRDRDARQDELVERGLVHRGLVCSRRTLSRRNRTGRVLRA